jgi:hypothetical protein
MDGYIQLKSLCLPNMGTSCSWLVSYTVRERYPLHPLAWWLQCLSGVLLKRVAKSASRFEVMCARSLEMFQLWEVGSCNSSQISTIFTCPKILNARGWCSIAPCFRRCCLQFSAFTDRYGQSITAEVLHSLITHFCSLARTFILCYFILVFWRI